MVEIKVRHSLDKNASWWGEWRDEGFRGTEVWKNILTVNPKTYETITTVAHENARFATCCHNVSHEISLLRDFGWFKEKEGDYTNEEVMRRIYKMQTKKSSKKKKTHKTLHENEVVEEFGTYKPKI